MEDPDTLKLHLEPYGFSAANEQAWTDPSPSADRPQLRLYLGGHSEMGNHTYYSIKCELQARRPCLDLKWETQKRLQALREDLHDTVKNELGKDYPDVFAAAPFAKRGGWGGTSDRLKKWLETLADAVNNGAAPPVLVSQVLLFFSAPPQSDHQISADTVPEGNGTPTMSPTHEPSPVAPDIDIPQDITPELKAPIAVGSSLDAGRNLDRQTSDEAPPSMSQSKDAVAEKDDDGLTKDEQVDSESEIKPRRSVSTILRGKSQPKIADQPRSKSADERSSEVLRSSAAGDSLEGLGMMQRRATSLGAKPKDDTIGYLEGYGYAAASRTQWSAMASSCGKPVLRLSLDGHCEEHGHTNYIVKCHLFSEKQDINYDWLCKRRLGHLREDLHDMVKDDLGKNYAEFFSQAPFARRGGLSGTTGRLQTWLETLSSCINDQHASPSLVASVLSFFGTPVPPKAKCSTPRKSLVPQVWGDPLPEEMRTVRSKSPSPAPPEMPPRAESPPQRKSNVSTPRKSLQRSASPEIQEDEEAGKGRQSEHNKEIHSDDETASQFDSKKRQNNYRKLRDWFLRIRQTLSRSTLPCASA